MIRLGSDKNMHIFRELVDYLQQPPPFHQNFVLGREDRPGGKPAGSLVLLGISKRDKNTYQLQSKGKRDVVELE